MLFRPIFPAVEMVHFGGEPAVEMVVHFESSLDCWMWRWTVCRWIFSSRAMRRIAQPYAAKVKIASRSFTWSMLAIVAAHTPALAGQCAALWHLPRWYILKPFISFPGGTLSVTADSGDVIRAYTMK